MDIWPILESKRSVVLDVDLGMTSRLGLLDYIVPLSANDFKESR